VAAGEPRRFRATSKAKWHSASFVECREIAGSSSAMALEMVLDEFCWFGRGILRGGSPAAR
jgi:hypothetical protein